MRFVPEGLMFWKKKDRAIPPNPVSASPEGQFTGPSVPSAVSPTNESASVSTSGDLLSQTVEATPAPLIQPLNPTDVVSRPADFAVRTPSPDAPVSQPTAAPTDEAA